MFNRYITDEVRKLSSKISFYPNNKQHKYGGLADANVNCSAFKRRLYNLERGTIDC